MSNSKRFPHLSAELIAQFDAYDAKAAEGTVPMAGADNSAFPTHPEVWAPANLLARPGITYARPSYGWESLTNGRYASGGNGAKDAYGQRTSYPNGR